MRLHIHEDTGTRHVPTDDDKHKSLCGYNGIDPQAYDKWDVGKSDHLEEFPEDFGDLPSDCDKCAKVWDKA